MLNFPETKTSVDLLRPNPTKWSNTLKQFVGNLQKIQKVLLTHI